MKVCYKRNMNTVQIGELQTGDCCILPQGEELLLVIEPMYMGHEYNSIGIKPAHKWVVSLNSGRMRYYEKTKCVIRVNDAKIVMERT